MNNAEWERYCALPEEFRSGDGGGHFAFSEMYRMSTVPMKEIDDLSGFAMEALAGWSLLVALRKRGYAVTVETTARQSVVVGLQPFGGEVEVFGDDDDNRDFAALLAAAEHISKEGTGQ